MASPLPLAWAVLQKNTLTCRATPGRDNGSTSACLWPCSEETLPAYWPVCKFDLISAIFSVLPVFPPATCLSSMNSYCLPKKRILIPRQTASKPFWWIFISISSIHSHSTRLPTCNNLCLPRVNSSSGKCSLTFVGPKVWSSIPNHIKSSTTFTFKWKLKKHLHEKDTQLWTFATFHSSSKKFCKF